MLVEFTYEELPKILTSMFRDDTALAAATICAAAEKEDGIAIPELRGKMYTSEHQIRYILRKLEDSRFLRRDGVRTNSYGNPAVYKVTDKYQRVIGSLSEWFGGEVPDGVSQSTAMFSSTYTGTVLSIQELQELFTRDTSLQNMERGIAGLLSYLALEGQGYSLPFRIGKAKEWLEICVRIIEAYRNIVIQLKNSPYFRDGESQSVYRREIYSPIESVLSEDGEIENTKIMPFAPDTDMKGVEFFTNMNSLIQLARTRPEKVFTSAEQELMSAYANAAWEKYNELMGQISAETAEEDEE